MGRNAGGGTDRLLTATSRHGEARQERPHHHFCRLDQWNPRFTGCPSTCPTRTNYSRPTGKSTVAYEGATDRMSVDWSAARGAVYFLSMFPQFFAAVAVATSLGAARAPTIRQPGPRPLTAFERRKAETLFRSKLPCLGCHQLNG